ncbi:MAG: GDP-mannose dehydrogenase [Candidatus Rokuibacteriota bacterium]|nr:MAG: GDP-mannose dehydrogenase [Candidatus Rokubacteria bacterium]
MRVSVFGLGYVGSVTAGCLADAGHTVVGVDVDEDKVRMVSAGTSPIVEPGLDELLTTGVRTGTLSTTTSAHEAVAATDVALICVGTPGRTDGRPDVGALERVARGIGLALRSAPKPYTVVLRSTVLPGTIDDVLIPTLETAAGPGSTGLRVASNPEFMREGTALRDFAEPPFTLVGTDDSNTAETVRELYARVTAPFVVTTVRTAEMVKYVSNAFHAVKIAFANEIGDLAEALGVDPHDVMRIFALDKKLNVSGAYLRPGFAFGGSCLPKDVRALVYAARTRDIAGPLLSSVMSSNEAQIRRAAQTILDMKRRRVGVVGLAFKPGTDDLRESPLVTLCETLIGKGCEVRVLDRHVSIARLRGANRRYIEDEIPHIASLMCDGPAALLAHADVIVIGNDSPDAARVLGSIRPGQAVVDLTRGTVSRNAGRAA